MLFAQEFYIIRNLKFKLNLSQLHYLDDAYHWITKKKLKFNYLSLLIIKNGHHVFDF